MGQHIFRLLARLLKPVPLPFSQKNKYNNCCKIWHTNIIIITMKTRRHARAARISTNIITITTTNMMKKGIITTIIIMKGDTTIIITITTME